MLLMALLRPVSISVYSALNLYPLLRFTEESGGCPGVYRTAGDEQSNSIRFGNNPRGSGPVSIHPLAAGYLSHVSGSAWFSLRGPRFTAFCYHSRVRPVRMSFPSAADHVPLLETHMPDYKVITGQWRCIIAYRKGTKFAESAL